MVESNKLMAKFLGYEYYLHSDIEKYPGWRKDKISYSHKINLQGKVGERQYLCRNHKQLAFDTDWNWLMQIVEKIESKLYFFNFAPFIDDETQDLSGEYYCMIIHGTTNMQNPIIDITGCSTKIQAVYLACLQFIQNESNT
jgi:hypothetical protein